MNTVIYLFIVKLETQVGRGMVGWGIESGRDSKNYDNFCSPPWGCVGCQWSRKEKGKSKWNVQLTSFDLNDPKKNRRLIKNQDEYGKILRRGYWIRKNISQPSFFPGKDMERIISIPHKKGRHGGVTRGDKWGEKGASKRPLVTPFTK